MAVGVRQTWWNNLRETPSGRTFCCLCAKLVDGSCGHQARLEVEREEADASVPVQDPDHECVDPVLDLEDAIYRERASLVDGEEFAGQHAVYPMRCRGCGEVVQTLVEPAGLLPWGARWSAKHQTFVLREGTAGGRVEQPQSWQNGTAKRGGRKGR